MHARGFTIAEVAVVIALIGVIGAFSASASIGGYQRASLHSERQSLIAALEHARAEAVNDMCEGNGCDSGADHGVAIQPGRYVIFQGTSYAARDADEDESISADPAFTHTGLLEIVFASSSGDVLQAGAAIIADGSGASSTVTVGSNGQIDWDH